MKMQSILVASQKFFDILILAGAVLIGVGVWFIPSVSSNPDYREMVKAVNARVAEYEAALAEREKFEAERAAELERTGAVYVIPLSPRNEAGQDAAE